MPARRDRPSLTPDLCYLRYQLVRPPQPREEAPTAPSYFPLQVAIHLHGPDARFRKAGVHVSHLPVSAAVRSCQPSLVLLALTFALLLGNVSTVVGEPSLVIVSYEKEALGLADVSVRLRITNDQAVSLLECDRTVVERPPETPCVAVGFRTRRPPPRVSFERLERASFAPDAIPVAPGATTETTVFIPTPYQPGNCDFYFYLITAGKGVVKWREEVLRVTVGAPPSETASNIRRTRLILTIYVVGTATAIMILLLQRRSPRRR